MSTPIYTKTNYRKNLTLYWQQYFPKWIMPKGYHVHHIKPKCTFEDKDDTAIHHPKNLIALHPDDHASIHKCRGDKDLSPTFITSIVGRVYTPTQATKDKISETMKGRPAHNKGVPHSNETKLKMSISQHNRPDVTNETRRKLSNAITGKKHSVKTKKKMSILKQNMTAETKKKMSESAKNRKPMSAETKLKLSLKAKEAWVRRKLIS